MIPVNTVTPIAASLLEAELLVAPPKASAVPNWPFLAGIVLLVIAGALLVMERIPRVFKDEDAGML